jgi:hypothetical protein
MVESSAAKPKMELLKLKEAAEDESGYNNKTPDPETIPKGAEKGDSGKIIWEP